MRSSVARVALVALVALLLAGCGTTGAAHESAPGPGPPAGPAGAHRGGGWPAPVEMHSLAAPASRGSDRATTYGLGDLDGDGRADLVQVRTDGRITAELTWLGHRSARVRPDPSLRLQALPDLDGDDRAEVLVASTAAGCCGGYRLPDTSSAVLVLDHGRLRLLRWASGEPARIRFAAGRGDVFAGVRCEGGVPHLLVALVEGATARVDDTTLAITGHEAVRGPTVQRTIPSGTVRAETRSRCRGLDAQGWAS